jgi:uncharacterized protein YbjT (DUF2867 family)
MILIAGGTGLLGREIIARLTARDASERVRVMTRDRQRAREFPGSVDVVLGDVRSEADVSNATTGITTVISAVHGFAGPGSPTPEAIDRDGNAHLVDAAKAAGVRHFVLVSVVDARSDHPMSLHRAKFAAEEHLKASGLGFTIVRATAFMERWSLVLGADLATKGRAMVFGDGTNPINFVSVRDVADVVVPRACAEPKGETIDVAGPENLGMRAFAEKLVRAHGRDARIDRIPRTALRVMSVLARPFAPAFARQAQAAVVMDTIPMSAEASSGAGTKLDAVLASHVF